MPYVDGFIVPVPKKSVQVYRRMAKKAGKIWREHGALEFCECVADDVKVGKLTSFPRSVKLKPSETVMFSWIVYRSRADRDRVEVEVGVAFFVASYSALRKAPVISALLVLGDMSVQGTIKPLRSLTEPLQVANDNGAKRALIPIENKRNFLDVSADIVEHVDPIFYGDPKTAAMKVLGNL